MNEVNETLSKYIDVDKVCLQCIAHHMCNEENCIVAQQPTADVVEVVRCKDCRYCEIGNKDGWCNLNDCIVYLDDFCSNGERMDGAE